MNLIFGSHGYLGSKIAAQHSGCFLSAERNLNFTDLVTLIDQTKPEIVINCAALIPPKTVDHCKNAPVETILANSIFPATLANACEMFGVPVIQLSTACLYDELSVHHEDEVTTRDLQGYCGLYLAEKIASEQAVRQYERHYILRLRLPFDNISSPRNYLNKMMAYPRIFDHVNSLTHRGDFAKAAIQLWQNKAEFGTYHVAAEGQISNRDVIAKLRKKGLLVEQPEFIPGNCTGCRLSTKKLADAGVKLRRVEEAVDDAINNWKE